MTWTRREFLVGTGSAALASGAGARSATAKPEAKSGYDAIVIGGGFAGLTTARELGQSGHRVLLLEARGRLGGRTFTAEFAGQSVELGGMWVHWAQPHVWAELTRYGLEVIEVPSSQPPPSMSILSQGERRDGSPQDLGALFGALARHCAPSAEVFPRPYEPFHSDQVERFDAISVRERLDELALEPRVNDLVDAYWATLCHGALEDASFAELLRIYALSGYNPVVMSAAVGGFKLRGGTRSLVEAMRQEAAAEVALGAAVAQVRQSDGGVVVETVAGESYTAACAVVAVPLNTLDRVRFEPAISPAKRAAASERHAGRGVKFYAQLRGDLGNVSGFAPGSSPVSWFATQHHGPEGTLIVAFGASPDALAISDRSAVQAALRAFLPEVEVVAVGGWDWNADPFSAGTWCMLRRVRPRATCASSSGPRAGSSSRAPTGPSAGAASSTAPSSKASSRRGRCRRSWPTEPRRPEAWETTRSPRLTCP
jgi:monoamine oxidase